jgi:ribonucleoside-triphosphate reductase
MSKALQEFTRISRYSRYVPGKNRRETWNEQVDRVFDQMHAVKYADVLDDIKEEYKFAKMAVRKKLVLGSQRALQFGGPAILKKHARMYNCVATYIDRARVFQETMWLLLCGCGCGFSVQKHHIAKLPEITPVNEEQQLVTFLVPDTIEGWGDTIGILMSAYFKDNQPFPEYYGKNVYFDFSQIRPKGSPISHMGGKAPGYEPLANAVEHIRKILNRCFENGQTKLRPIDAYDIIMHSSDAVLAGGVRRSATICVFSPDDDEMIKAKTGNWFIDNPQRGRSNNSVMLLRNKTTKEQFSEIMKSVKSFGEPGFVWSDSTEVIFNPCVEISLYPVDEVTGKTGWEFCNLCEINMKDVPTEQDFYDACRAGAILGTLQAGYTDFKYLGEITERIVKREALLGVSMTGMMDNPKIAFNPKILQNGATIVRKTNQALAKKIGINPAARTTCVKPAGSTSCVLGTASGIHPHHAKKYFRRVQVNKLEPPQQFFRGYNPTAVEESVWSANKTDDVVTFLCEVPKDALTKNDVNAIQLLEYVKLVQENWVQYGKEEKLCVKPFLEHNVSNTINVKPDEWEAVTDFIHANRRNFTGISLLPMSGDKIYKQAPFQAVYTPQELVDNYGNGAMFSSGLIIHALQAFNNDLFDACGAVLGQGAPLEIPDFKDSELELESQIDTLKNIVERRLFVERARKFARRYFGGDLEKMTFCLKDIDAWKKWCDLKRTYVDVPWIEFKEKKDNVKHHQTIACSGGACELVRM